MSGNKKYYWLKLNDNFFEDDTVTWLEEQENGKDYIIFYLKLCLKSLQNDGSLIRYVGEKLIPYDIKALANLTDTKIDTVAVAMKTFEEIGLVSRLESGEIYLNQINEMIGSETDSAKRMRKARAKENALPSHCANKVIECDIDVQKGDTEIEKEKELDIEKEKRDIKQSKQASIDSEFESLWELYPNRKGKAGALKSYKKALKDGTTFEEIETGIQNYLAYIQSNRISIGYVKHGSTWFNSKGWLDEYENGKEQRMLGKVAKGESYGGLEF